MKHRQPPYRQPDQSRISVTGWFIALNEGDAEPLMWENKYVPPLDTWDAAASLTVGVELALDVAGILADCQLPPTAALCAALLWESEGTTLRGCGTIIPIETHLAQQNVALHMRLDGSRLSQSLEITPTIAVSTALETTDHFAPRLPGTILWNSSRMITLGTSGMRFPIEMQDFSQAVNIFPSGASWFLDWDRESFDRPVHGGLRLYINRSNPVMKRAVMTNGKPNDADSRVQEVVLFDAARSLITSALESDDFSDQLNTYQAGSIGNHIQNLIAALFPHESFQSLRTQWKFNRWLFDSRLQETMRLFQKD